MSQFRQPCKWCGFMTRARDGICRLCSGVADKMIAAEREIQSAERRGDTVTVDKFRGVLDQIVKDAESNS